MYNHKRPQHITFIKNLFSGKAIFDLSGSTVARLHNNDIEYHGHRTSTDYGFRNLGVYIYDPKPYKYFLLSKKVVRSILHTQLLLTNQRKEHYPQIIAMNWAYLEQVLKIIYEDECRENFLEQEKKHHSELSREDDEKKTAQMLQEYEEKDFWPQMQNIFKQTVLYRCEEKDPETNNQRHIDFMLLMTLHTFYAHVFPTPLAVLQMASQDLEGLLDHTPIKITAAEIKAIRGTLRETITNLEQQATNTYLAQTTSTVNALFNTSCSRYSLGVIISSLGFGLLRFLDADSTTFQYMCLLIAAVCLLVVLKQNHDTYQFSYSGQGRMLSLEMREYFYKLANSKAGIEYIWKKAHSLRQGVEERNGRLSGDWENVANICDYKKQFSLELKTDKPHAVEAGAALYAEQIIDLQTLVPLQEATQVVRNRCVRPICFTSSSSAASSSNAGSSSASETDYIGCGFAPQYMTVEALPKLPKIKTRGRYPSSAAQDETKNAPSALSPEIKLAIGPPQDGILIENYDGKRVFIRPGNQPDLFNEINAFVEKKPACRERFATKRENVGLERCSGGEGWYLFRFRKEFSPLLHETGATVQWQNRYGKTISAREIVPTEKVNPHQSLSLSRLRY